MIQKAARFAEVILHVPSSEALMVAADAVTFIWEECKFGRLVAEDEPTFWAFVSERLYKTKNSWRINSISLDAPIPNTEGEADGHEAGWNGYEPPDQLNVCFLNQVKEAIELLPERHRIIMRLLSEGWSALDMSEKLRVPVHTIFHRITDARQMLFTHNLIAIAADNRRATSLEREIGDGSDT